MWLRKQGEQAARRGPLAREMNRVPMLISPATRFATAAEHAAGHPHKDRNTQGAVGKIG
jgi:hypothetical protein